MFSHFFCEFSTEFLLSLIWNWIGADVHVADWLLFFFCVTDVLTDITKIYALSENSVREFQLHALMGWEFESTIFPNIKVYRLDFCNVLFLFPVKWI